MLKFLPVYFLAALAICWPALPFLNVRYLGGASLDAGLYIYLCHSALEALFNGSWFSTNAFYPYGLSLAWSDNFILPAALFQLFNFVLNEILAFNLVIISALTLNGLAFYYLARKLDINEKLTHFFAISASCFAYFSSQLGHPQILFFFFVPLALGLLIDFLHKPRFRTLTIFAFNLLACFLTTVYYAVFIALLAAVFGFFILLKHYQSAYSVVKLWRSGLLVLFIPAFLAFAWPYVQVKAAFGPRFLYEAAAFALSPADLLSPSSVSLLYSSFSFGNPENQFFPGFIIILLTGLGLTLLPGNKRLLSLHWLSLFLFITSTCWPALFANSSQLFIRYLLLITTLPLILTKSFFQKEPTSPSPITGILLLCSALFLILATGPITTDGSQSLDPFIILFKYVPGVEALRAVARYALASFMIYYLLGMYSLTQLKVKTKYLVLPLFLIFIENIPARVPIEEPSSAPKLLTDLPTPKNGELKAVVALPMATRFDKLKQPASWTEYSRLNVNYMNWFHDSKYYLVNGYSGQRSRIIKEFPEKLHNFPDLRSITALKHIAGLQYVIYNSKDAPQFKKQTFERSLAQYAESLRLLKVENGLYLFELLPQLKDLSSIYLMIPAYMDLNLNLQVQTDPSCMPQDSPQLAIQDSASGSPKIFPIAVGKPLNINFKLSRNVKNLVSPRKVTFSTNLDCPIELLSYVILKDMDA